jgi:ABC-2 type transport system ATP-binding protein
MDRGRVLHDGAPDELIDHARGHVWVAERADSTAQVSWRTSSGQYRLIGDPPPGAELVPPALEDAYLLLLGLRAADADVAVPTRGR